MPLPKRAILQFSRLESEGELHRALISQSKISCADGQLVCMAFNKLHFSHRHSSLCLMPLQSTCYFALLYECNHYYGVFSTQSQVTHHSPRYSHTSFVTLLTSANSEETGIIKNVRLETQVNS